MKAADKSLILNRLSSHGILPHLLEGALTPEDGIENPSSEMHLISLKVQDNTVFPHEHGTYFSVVSVDNIKVMVPSKRIKLEVREEAEVYLRPTTYHAQLKGYWFLQFVYFEVGSHSEFGQNRVRGTPGIQ
jgi:hypothetical protein